LRKPSKAAKLLVKMLKQVPSGKHCQWKCLQWKLKEEWNMKNWKKT
jgi:hypothetical protein